MALCPRQTPSLLPPPSWRSSLPTRAPSLSRRRAMAAWPKPSSRCAWATRSASMLLIPIRSRASSRLPMAPISSSLQTAASCQRHPRMSLSLPWARRPLTTISVPAARPWPAPRSRRPGSTASRMSIRTAASLKGQLSRSLPGRQRSTTTSPCTSQPLPAASISASPVSSSRSSRARTASMTPSVPGGVQVPLRAPSSSTTSRPRRLQSLSRPWQRRSASPRS